MLSPTGWWLAVAPVDLRCGIDRLLVRVGEVLGQAPTSGGAYVFRNRAGTRIKVLCVDAHGVWLCVRRLHQGRFHWPRAGEAVFTLLEKGDGGNYSSLDYLPPKTRVRVHFRGV